jgi:hypothetical protein
MSICLCASSLYNICYVSLRHSPELEEYTPDPDHYLLAHITTISDPPNNISHLINKLQSSIINYKKEKGQVNEQFFTDWHYY